MKKILIAGLSALMIMVSGVSVYASELTQSARWVGSGERWQVSDNAGGYLKNCWFQDDITGHWYMLGAEDGSIMYAGLITDQSTGKTYLLNTNHDGTYGRMISTNGVYSLNGRSVNITFNQNHDGTFGAITSGLSEARSSGIPEKQLSSIPTDNKTTTAGGNQTSTNNQGKGSYYDGMPVDSNNAYQTEWDLDGDGKLTGIEYDMYIARKAMDGVEQAGIDKKSNIH